MPHTEANFRKEKYEIFNFIGNQRGTFHMPFSILHWFYFLQIKSTDLY